MGYSDAAGIVINWSHRRSSSSRSPKSSRPKRRETRPSILATRDAKSRGVTEIRANRFSLSVSTPEVPATKSVSFSAASRSPTLRAASRISMPRIARWRASAPSRHGFTRTRSLAPKFLIDRATAPTFPSFFGSTRTTRIVGTLRSIYCTTDIPWHAGRPQDRLRRRRVLRPPAPAGPANRGRRVHRRLACGETPPRSERGVLPKRESDRSGRECRRQRDRVRSRSPGGCCDRSLQQSCTRCVGVGVFGRAADVPPAARARTLVSLPPIRGVAHRLPSFGRFTLRWGARLSLVHVGAVVGSVHPQSSGCDTLRRGGLRRCARGKLSTWHGPSNRLRDGRLRPWRHHARHRPGRARGDATRLRPRSGAAVVPDGRLVRVSISRRSEAESP